MTTVVTFEPAHLAAFVPGSHEAQWLDEMGRDRVAEVMASDATLTIMADGMVVGFTGCRDVYLWSMWSDYARRHPLAMSRACRRLLPIWREMCGRELVALDEGNALQKKFARWLGMTERSPGVWVA